MCASVIPGGAGGDCRFAGGGEALGGRGGGLGGPYSGDHACAMHNENTAQPGQLVLKVPCDFMAIHHRR